MPCQAAFQAEVLSPLPLAALCFPRWDFPPLMASLSFPVGIIEFFWHHHIFHGSFEDIIFFSNDLTFFSLQFPKFSIKVTKHATEPMGEWKILLFSGELIFCFIMKRRLVYLAFQATVTLMRMYKEKHKTAMEKEWRQDKGRIVNIFIQAWRLRLLHGGSAVAW